MSQQQKTHRQVKIPQMSSRILSDYMAASDTAKRSIIRDAKYPSIARVIQHDEAKMSISKFITGAKNNLEDLREKEYELRRRMADSEFDRDLYDHNADYIKKFIEIFSGLNMPDAEIRPVGSCPAFKIGPVKITPELHFRLRRTTRTNKVRVGAGMLRYAKGKNLPAKVAEWQSAFLFGYLASVNPEDGADVERKLCVTLDAYGGIFHPAPGDSARRFSRMESACATIGEWWPQVQPPPGAAL